MLKKHLSQLVAVCAIAACALFTFGCGGDDLPDDPNDTGDEEKDFEMGDEK